MNIVQRKIDKEYFELFVGYVNQLVNSWCNNYFISKYEFNVKINTATKKIVENYFDSYNIPVSYKKKVFYYIEDLGFQLPPACIWISKTGRFSAHDIQSLLGEQAFALWDNKRKVLMPEFFHDLSGLDEQNEVLFCRHMPGSRFNDPDENTPFKVNLEWIEILNFKRAFYNDYLGGRFFTLPDAEKEDVVKSGIILLDYLNDILDHLLYTNFEDVLYPYVELILNNAFTEDNKQKLIWEIKSHPFSSELLKNEDKLESFLSMVTSNVSEMRKIKALLLNVYNDNFNNDEMPF